MRFWVPELRNAGNGGNAEVSDKAIFDPYLMIKEADKAKAAAGKKNAVKNFFVKKGSGDNMSNDKETSVANAYPKPIVEHKVVSQQNIAKFKTNLERIKRTGAIDASNEPNAKDRLSQGGANKKRKVGT